MIRLNESKQLYNIVNNTLRVILPEVLIKYYVYEYIDKYNYVCSINYNYSLHSIYFNEQLRTLCCSSIEHHQLYDFDHGGYKSLVIDTKFFNKTQHRIIHFNENIILTHSYISGKIDKYVLDDHIYKYISSTNSIYQYCSAYLQYPYLYVCDQHNLTQYWIIVYDINTLTEIRRSKSYLTINLTNSLDVSIHQNIIYICDFHSSELMHIHIHDIKTFKRLKQYVFKLQISVSHIQLYKNKIYCYNSPRIIIYDMLCLQASSKTKDIPILNEIYSFDIIQSKHKSKYRRFLSINNDMLMISNGEQIILYAISS
jgi:hypothetical protein